MTLVTSYEMLLCSKINKLLYLYIVNMETVKIEKNITFNFMSNTPTKDSI